MEAPETPGDVGKPEAAPDPQDQLDYLAFLKFLPQDELEWQDRGAWPAAWRPQSTIGRLFSGAHCPAGRREIRAILLTPLFGRPAGDPTGDGQLVNLVAEFAISRGKVIVGHRARHVAVVSEAFSTHVVQRA